MFCVKPTSIQRLCGIFIFRFILFCFGRFIWRCYNALPDDIKKNLDLAKMKDGSNDPDENFKDTASHHYPKTYPKATKWLNDAKTNYDKKDYEQASYCFGVASHYISDMFSAPHCVDHESSEDHHKFEVATNALTPTATYISGDLNSLMEKVFCTGSENWANWMEK